MAHHMIDACQLIAHEVELDERVRWLQRGVEHAHEAELTASLGQLYTDLGAARDLLDEPEVALESYTRALEWNRAHGAPRSVVGSLWAVGAAACRVEDWPLARTRLEEALQVADGRDDSDDLVGFALAELARVNEAAGDVIEARRLLLRSLAIAREQQLEALWPRRWAALTEFASRLEVL